jgi:hypothetical protein
VHSLVEKLSALRAKDVELKVFGASAHRYKLNAPLSEEDVRRIEKNQDGTPMTYFDWYLDWLN